MHITIAILVLQYTLCLTIKVPVNWDDNSDVNPVTQDKPNEYFYYTANKPQFAVDIAKFHDVKSPEKHYQSYPIKPHTGVIKPDFGKHEMLDSRNINYKPYQEYVNQENHGHIKPVSNYYEVYHHPYQAEVPSLQEIYKDPVLNKIRNDVRDSKTRLQKYEHDTGKSEIHSDEYLERPEHIDIKKVPHRNTPAQFEIHKPLRRPIYYQRVPLNRDRERFLNKKLRHQNYGKVTPMHYHPLKHNLLRLRQQHALTYDDDRNEYPQIIQPERYAEKPDGYDIYQKGQDKYQQIRNVFDESINKAIVNNRPVVNDNLELQKENYNINHPEHDEEIFVPIKNYAQVRKTETYKHLPKSAALQDAQNLEEIQSAPRLREAIKSSKNQVVYSEEGYEDSAYDHAGEQKHSSDHEGHGGFLKENEVSKGKYKIPTVDVGYADNGQSTSRDQVLHGEKWNDEHTDIQDENESEDYSENEDDYSLEADIKDPDSDEFTERNKRESNETQINNKNSFDHEVTKRDVFSNSSQPFHIIGLKENPIENKTLSEKQTENLKKKYPYYFNGTKNLNQNSPLRYSENLEFIPKKNIDESAFYNSRIALECPDVESDINPVPEKFKNDEVSAGSDSENYDDDEQGEEEFKNFKNKQRLRGLGDKIDCLKVKYFGEDPLDSPFFTEKSIHNPMPLMKPNSKVFSVSKFGDKSININNIKILDQNISIPKEHKYENQTFSAVPSADLDIVLNNFNNISSKTAPLNSNFTYKQNVTKLPFSIRKKRAATFMYEPYKVIKESQSSDSKRPVASSNVSPLIKKLQIRQIIDKTSLNNEKNYKDFGKNDRPSNLEKAEFVDVSMDHRRGEPRYELDLKNHRSHYSPSESRTSISVDDYKAKIANETDANVNTVPKNTNTQRYKKSRHSFSATTTNRPHFDVSKYLPQTYLTQNIAASNTVPKIIHSTTIGPQVDRVEDIIEDDYEEYEDDEDDDDDDDDEEDEILTTTTTSTTTKRPVSKKRIRIRPAVKPTNQNDSMKLHLVTRFHTSTTDAIPTESMRLQSKNNKFQNKEDIVSPKYREKKKKSTKSTRVTDTESYGDDEDDMKKEEIDALIGVKQDMDEYTPMYEKKEEQKDRIRKENKDYDTDGEEDEKEFEENDEYDVDDDDDDDDSSDDRDFNNEHHFARNNRYKEKENSEENQEDHKTPYKNTVNINDKQPKLEVTTSEPTKRTLIKTTEPTSTTEVLFSDLQPKIFRKKVEIHKELPVNRTSPHKTHFEQDIKEVEIIKELDKSKTKHDLKDFNLYKDENLAKEINNLGDIEIFKDDLDFENDQRHGGNYRSIKTEDLRQVNPNSKSDIATSETETKKVIELDTSTIKPRLRSSIIRSSNKSNHDNNQSEFNEEKEDKSRIKKPNAMLRQGRNRFNSGRAAKLIELDDSSENIDDSRNMHGGNFKESGTRNYNRAMHGGNYRSAKLIRGQNSQEVSTEKSITRENNSRKRSRKTEAELLNRYANAISIITTTPAYILDPSKRMYYYVEK